MLYTDKFVSRHGPRDHEIDEMLKVAGVSSIDEPYRPKQFLKTSG